MGKEKTVILGQIEGTIEKPFVLKWKEPVANQADGQTNVFADTAALHSGIAPDSLSATETVGSTGFPGETADTTFLV